MKAVVIGTGKMGRIHVRVYHQLGVLSGVCDLDNLSAHNLANQYNVCTYNNLDEVLSSKPDLITIATPTPTHTDIAVTCIEKGVNVLIEKPIANTLDDAEKIKVTAKNSKSIVTVGYIERYNPVFIELLKRIRSNEFGDITSINIKRVGGVPRSADNVITDVMTHDLNLLLTLFNKYPEQVYTHRREAGKIVHSAQTLLDFGTASATCEANWLSPTKIRSIVVTGTNSYAEIDMIKQEITQFDRSSRITYVFNEEPLKNELSAFLKAIKTKDTSKLVSIQEAINTLSLTKEVSCT